MLGNSLKEAQQLSGLPLAQHAVSKNLAAEMRELKIACTFDGEPIEAKEIAGMGQRGCGGGIVANAVLLLSGCGLRHPDLKFSIGENKRAAITTNSADAHGWLLATFAASYVAREWLKKCVMAAEAEKTVVESNGVKIIEIKKSHIEMNLLLSQQLARNGVWEIKSSEVVPLSQQNTKVMSEYLERV